MPNVYVCPGLRKREIVGSAGEWPRTKVLPLARMKDTSSPIKQNALGKAGGYLELLHYVQSNPLSTTYRRTFSWLQTEYRKLSVVVLPRLYQGQSRYTYRD